MWILWIAVLAIVAAIFGAVIGGGIFTLVLVPIAVVAIVTALAVWLVGYLSDSPSADITPEAAQQGKPLPRTRGESSAQGPSSPGQLADVRREQQ